MIETRCGLCCSTCEYRESMHCGGCIETMGHPFHGECPVAVCAQGRGIRFCGECMEFPCKKLVDYSNDPEQGDIPKGARIETCRKWWAEDRPRYQGTLLAVSDMALSKRFYTELLGQRGMMDLGVNQAFEGFFLQQGFAGLAGFDEKSVKRKSNNAELYFEVRAIEAFQKKLDAWGGIEYLHPMKEYPWGQRVIRFYDPDWHIIEVGEDMAVVVHRFLAQGMSPEKAAERTGYPLPVVLNFQKTMERKSQLP